MAITSPDSRGKKSDNSESSPPSDPLRSFEGRGVVESERPPKQRRGASVTRLSPHIVQCTAIPYYSLVWDIGSRIAGVGKNIYLEI